MSGPYFESGSGYAQSPHSQASAIKRWLETSGPLYEDREIVVTEDMDELDGLNLSFASEMIYFAAEIGASIIVKVRIR